MILKWKLESTVERATFHPNWSDQMAFPHLLKVQFDCLIMQNRFPGDLASDKKYQHLYNRPYGDFQFFGLQIRLYHRLDCVQSCLRGSPSLTPFSSFNCCKPAKNQFFLASDSAQTTKMQKNVLKPVFDRFWAFQEKSFFFFEDDRQFARADIYSFFTNFQR